MRIRNVLLGSAVVALMAAPGVAQAGSGYAGVSYSSADPSVGSEVDTINVTAAAVFELSEAWDVQVDGQFGRVEASGFNHTYNAAAAHVFHRNDTFLIGGYLGTEEAAFNVDAQHLGVEGQLYVSRVTFDAGVDFTNAESGVLDETGYTARAGATVFVMENLSLGVSYRIMDAGPLDSETIAARAEWQLGDGPLSFTAGYRTSEVEPFDSEAYEIGLRWNFGGGSLLERSRTGASLPANTTTVGGFY